MFQFGRGLCVVRWADVDGGAQSESTVVNAEGNTMTTPAEPDPRALTAAATTSTADTGRTSSDSDAYIHAARGIAPHGLECDFH